MMDSGKRRKLCAVLIAANLAFIWGNSMVTGTDSGNLSGGVLAWLNGFLGLDESGAEVLHLLIRKAAHFSEFACLGLLLAGYCCLCGEKHAMAFPVLLGMAAAVVDESIQMFTPDRGPSLTDVWIDVSGVLAGTLLLYLGQQITKKKQIV
jgi:VanZ family protein